MCAVLLRLKKNNLNMVATLLPHLTELIKIFQAVCFDIAHVKASVELCINKPSDATAKSELNVKSLLVN